MKVQSVELRCFKRFGRKTISLADEETGLAKDLIVLIGENGAGKSTILQAIAATLGTATRRLAAPAELRWPGFSLELLGGAWTSAPEVELVVEFSRDEIEATAEYFGLLSTQRAMDTRWVAPGRERYVTLSMREGRVVSTSDAAYFQCRGRDYARQIVRMHPDGHRIFERVGQVFWYTEHRTTTSLTPSDAGHEAPKLELPLLRRRLADWYYFHRDLETGARPLRAGERDIYTAIQQAYAAVFPGRRMQAPKPRTDIDDIMKEPWFYFTDGDRQYELAELSGGERAVFPLIVDFANWNLNNSVILIDEIELHLHPPMQQALVRALRRLGNNNQFIITTHSDAVVDILPEASILRVRD
jgi:hypothetical protein